MNILTHCDHIDGETLRRGRARIAGSAMLLASLDSQSAGKSETASYSPHEFHLDTQVVGVMATRVLDAIADREVQPL